MAPDAGNGDNVPVSLEAGVHGPQDIVGVKNVHVLIHQDDMLELGEGGEGQQSRLPLLPFIRMNGLS